MLSSQAAMKGSRLQYVIVPIPDNLKRVKYVMEKVEAGLDKEGKPRYTHRLTPRQVTVPGGFLVYFPKGHVLRMTSKEIRRYNLQNTPQIVNLTGLHDPTSPVGRMFMAQDQDSRVKGFKELEQLGIRLAIARTGPQIITKEQSMPDAIVDEGDGYVDLAAGDRIKPERQSVKEVK